MKMNLLTGAHAELIPHMNKLYSLVVGDIKTLRVEDVLSALDAILDYKVDEWVEDIIVDMIIDALQKLPKERISDISMQFPLHDEVPLRLCLYLMDQNDLIAEKVIEDTDLLDEMDLMYRVHSGQINELMAIARRKDLTPDILLSLIECKRPQVYLELLDNPSVQVREDVVRHLKERLEESMSGAWAMASHVRGTQSQSLQARA